MSPAATHCLLAAAALLAFTGCSYDGLDRSTAMMPAALASQPSPDAGHEVHRMFEAEKAAATSTELPAQF